MKKTVYEWRRLSYRLLIVSCLLFAAACWLGYELDSMIYFYILAAGGFLFMLASAIVYYEFWRCPKCDAKLPNESAFFGTVCRSVHMRQGIPVKCDIIRQNPYFMQNG